MYCPHCGQQQLSNETRFCSRCGMPLHAVAQLLANNGTLDGLIPQTSADNIPPRRLSPRQKGLRQAAMLFFIGVLLTPILGVLSEAIDSLELLVALCAIVCFVGALVRLMYALLFEERYPASPIKQDHALNLPAARPASFVPGPGDRAAPAYLPPSQQSQQIFSVVDVQRQKQPGASRRDTDELASPPPSVTENTTRLLKISDAEKTAAEREKN